MKTKTRDNVPRNPYVKAMLASRRGGPMADRRERLLEDALEIDLVDELFVPKTVQPSGSLG